MSNKTKKKKKNINKRFDAIMKRKGMNIVLILAVLILVVSIVSLSFSWFSPGSRTGKGVGFNADIAMRSENCTIKTYKSNSINVSSDGKITYDEVETTGNVTVNPGERVYFKTDIENQDSVGTNISLYISEIPSTVGGSDPGVSSFSAIGLGVATPSNTYHTYTAKQSDVYIIRNAFVHGNDGSDEEYTTTVEWFVRNYGSSDVVIDLDKLYIMYN